MSNQKNTNVCPFCSADLNTASHNRNCSAVKEVADAMTKLSGPPGNGKEAPPPFTPGMMDW